MGIYLQLRQYITLVDTLARLELKAETRRFALGYVWWFLEPMLYVAVFYLVFDQLLGTRQPDFLVFLTVGKLTFIWFSKSVNQASISLVNSKGIIAQVNLPKHLFPFSVVQEGLDRQAAVFFFLLLFLLLSGYSPRFEWLWLMPLVLLQYLLITGCALLAALLVCLRRDFQKLIQLGTVFLLFMSGVFWDVRALNDTALVEWLSHLNPLLVLLSATSVYIGEYSKCHSAAVYLFGIAVGANCYLGCRLIIVVQRQLRNECAAEPRKCLDAGALTDANT